MNEGWIIVMSEDRRIVWNCDAGWVDRDVGGATVFPDEVRNSTGLPMGGEWEKHDDA